MLPPAHAPQHSLTRAAFGLTTLLALVCTASAVRAAPVKGKPDRAAPTVAISSPLANASLAGTVIVTGTAADNVSVARVEVSVDGRLYRVATGTTRWSIGVDTRSVSNGPHLITARGVDAAGNSGQASVAVTFANQPAIDATPPLVTISRPATGTTVEGTVTVLGSATDDAAVARVELSLDGGVYRLAEGTTSWTSTLDTTSYPDGSHLLTARATDVAGNTSSSAGTVEIRNAPIGAPATPVAAPALAPGSLGGYTFREEDRDGTYEIGEEALADQRLYLFDAAGTYLKNTSSDSSGWFEFTGLADGVYRVQFAPASWWSLRDVLVPDTTESLFPGTNVSLQGTRRVDFGWRPIVRATQAGSPITAYVGPTGLKVESYNDVVPASAIYDRLLAGSLVGLESSRITVRFDLTKTGSTSAMAIHANGVYADYQATSNITYLSWLDGDGELFHEYGHAWSLFYAYVVQQDPSLTAYVAARGLAGDTRVGTSYAWDPHELVAEDYRQLFGSATARAIVQMNREIPAAKDVPGLAEFLSTAFTAPPTR
jgi:hypothetical protein